MASWDLGFNIIFNHACYIFVIMCFAVHFCLHFAISIGSGGLREMMMVIRDR